MLPVDAAACRKRPHSPSSGDAGNAGSAAGSAGDGKGKTAAVTATEVTRSACLLESLTANQKVKLVVQLSDGSKRAAFVRLDTGAHVSGLHSFMDRSLGPVTLSAGASGGGVAQRCGVVGRRGGGVAVFHRRTEAATARVSQGSACSALRLGDQVHAQIAAFANKGLMPSLARAIAVIEQIKKMKLEIVCAELCVSAPDFSVATAVDLVCRPIPIEQPRHDGNVSKRSKDFRGVVAQTPLREDFVLFEVKVGMDSPHRGLGFLRVKQGLCEKDAFPPYTFFNRALLQLQLGVDMFKHNNPERNVKEAYLIIANGSGVRVHAVNKHRWLNFVRVLAPPTFARVLPT